MKRILITGANSYIGTSFEKYIKKNYANGFSVDTIDMIDGSWRKYDFSGYDTVFHVAGIAHSDARKVAQEEKNKYYEVNTHLTVETAKKAKFAGVKQFVFMSSIIVFGSKNKVITHTTEPNPDNFYGDSKLQADIGIHALENEMFKVVSIRPPMIYGYGSKGNYSIMAKFAKKTPVFPKYNNKRSMLYIENLCEFLKLVIDNEETGYFYPQNTEYVNTSDMVYRIALSCGKNIILTKLFNPIIWMFRNHKIMRKVFGDMYYEQGMSKYKKDYNRISYEDSIERSEKFEKSINACFSSLDDR